MTTMTPAAGLTTRPPAGTNPRPSYEWMDRALCAQVGGDVWFSETGNVAAGVRICRRCPVMADCGEFAEATEGDTPKRLRFGVWGGLTPAGRTSQGRPRPNPDRDRAILRLTADGKSAAEIAEELGCTPRTVTRVRARGRRAA